MPPTAEELAQQEADAKAEADKATQTLIHSAVVTHLKKLLPTSIAAALKDSLPAALESIVAPLKEQLSQQSGESKSDTKDPAKHGDIESHPLVKGLQKTLADQKAITDRMQAERDAEKAKVRDTGMRQRLADELTKIGIDPRYVRAAAGNLLDVEKRVRFDDDNDDVLVFKDATGDVDLATGLKGWIKSEDAKIYLPPRGTQGAGDRSGGRSTQTGQTVPSLGAALLGMARVATPGDSQG